MQSSIELLTAVNGLLLIIIAYFAKSLVAKINQTADMLTHLDKTIALIAHKIDSQKASIDRLYKVQERQDDEIKKMRENIHRIRNDMNNISLKQEACKSCRLDNQ